LTHIDETQLRERLGSGRPIVADFTATWCAPCRAIAPELDKLEASYGTDVDFVKIDVDENPQLAQDLRVMGVPTVVHFGSDGNELARSTGAMPAPALAVRLSLTK
jgi:thioredoxin 1